MGMQVGRSGFECDVCHAEDGSALSFSSYVALLEHRACPAHRRAAGRRLGPPPRVDDPARIRARLSALRVRHGLSLEGSGDGDGGKVVLHTAEERMARHREEMARRAAEEAAARTEKRARRRDARRRRKAETADLSDAGADECPEALASVGVSSFGGARRA